MAIYCMQCGKELPDDANFCLKCGKQVGSAAQSVSPPEPKWEYCEIVYQQRREKHWYYDKDFFQFWAKGVGSNGTFNAGEVEEVESLRPNSERSKDHELADQLIKILTSKGWELLPNRGEGWFSYKFRRQAKV